MEDPRIISALFIFLKMAYYNVLINTVYEPRTYYVTLRMVKENIILYQQAPNYEYEFVMRVENMLTVFSILAVALHIKMFGPSVVFLLFFLNLRKVTGGYHAETFLRCFIMSNIIFWCITQIVYPFLLQKELMLTLAITTLSFVLIFVLGVVNNSNWNLEYYSNRW